jgi:hypothetical protein
MKDQSQVAIQYSGYPLTVAEPTKKTKEDPGLPLVRIQPDPKTTFIQKSPISNDPQYWDLSWFNGYE